MLRRILFLFAILAAIVAGPLLLRPAADTLEAHADERLVVITPHNQTIRRAFSEAFARHVKQSRGKNVFIDWRVPGGTSEVRKLLDSEFAAAATHGRPGVGIDVLFGGGAYDFDKQADAGQLVPSRIFHDQPDLFRRGIIPATFTGETFYHPRGLWLGVCLSSFGIVYNPDAMSRLGMKDAPKEWADLARPEFRAAIALADPSKSGSVNKAFEMLIQEQMQKALAAIAPDAPDPKRARDHALRDGWAAGLQLIQKIGANARYFTDSSAQIPLDVAQGNAAAGMCIDFYGRTYNEQLRQSDGSSRVHYFTPPGGSSVSVDAVAILRGAPHAALAEEFLAFLVSTEGQRLWNLKPGVPGAPPHALRRLPVRRDIYQPEDLALFSDPEELPYGRADGFTYRAELTAPAFNALAVIVRAMCLDSHDELKEAWKVLIEHDFPPQASAAFSDVSIVGYENAMGPIRQALKSKDRIVLVEQQQRIGQAFRENYRRTISLAKQKR